MKYNNTIFPAQKISLKQKTEDWGNACVDYVVGTGSVSPAGSDFSSVEDIQSLYDLYNSIIDQKELRYVTDPFNQEDGFPATLHSVNVIKPKIDLLLGEETKRPFNFRVIRTSQDAASDIQDKMKEMMTNYLMGQITSGFDEKQAAQYQEQLASGEIMPPEKIMTFISRDYKDVAESTAYHSINYLKEILNLPHEFSKGWKDALIAGKEVYYNGVYNMEPYLERVNPKYFTHDQSPDIEFIEDGDFACRKMRMSVPELHDRFYDKLSEKQLDDLLDLVGGNPSSNGSGLKQGKSNMDFNHYEFKSILGSDSSPFSAASQIDVYHACWRSFKKVGFVTIIGETGEVETIQVSEDYMKIGNEISIEWKWAIEIWEGYRAGQNIYFGVQPIDYQHVSSKNPNSQKLPYSGVIYNNSNSKSKSLVAIMKPLQYMHTIALYRLELAMARDKGKVLNMDITQIPKSMNIDPAKWMHYLSAVGVNFINPYEEGWDVPGREGGKQSSFNQITSVDLTMANVIGQYISLMEKIEEMISEISGVSRQRQGSVSSSELVGNVEKSIMQSAHITESLFWTHSQAKRNALRMLLNTAKAVWRDSGKTHLQYVMNDASRTFMQLAEEFFYEDMDIFVSDSTKDMQNLEAIKTLYQPAMQNGATLLDVAEIMTLDSVSEIKDKLAGIEKLRAEQEQSAADAENQRQAQLIQLQNQSKEQEMMIMERKLDLEKYKIDTDAQTKLRVAELNAYKNQVETDSDNDGMPDVMEIADLALRQNQLASQVADRELLSMQKDREHASKIEVEKKKIDNQRKSEETKAKLEREKLALEDKKLKAMKELQLIKDKAAMQREQLKAKTVIKNKTAGEK